MYCPALRLLLPRARLVYARRDVAERNAAAAVAARARAKVVVAEKNKWSGRVK